jgi:hypothetical protein
VKLFLPALKKIVLVVVGLVVVVLLLLWQALPRIDIRSFVLAGGKVDYADRRRAADGFLTTVEQIEAKLTGLRVPERGDPGPLSTQQPKMRDALEALYKERAGATDLAALKEGFRSANPGQPEESAAGKVMSRLFGLLHAKKTLRRPKASSL